MRTRAESLIWFGFKHFIYLIFCLFFEKHFINCRSPSFWSCIEIKEQEGSKLKTSDVFVYIGSTEIGESTSFLLLDTCSSMKELGDILRSKKQPFSPELFFAHLNRFWKTFKKYTAKQSDHFFSSLLFILFVSFLLRSKVLRQIKKRRPV